MLRLHPLLLASVLALSAAVSARAGEGASASPSGSASAPADASQPAETAPASATPAAPASSPAASAPSAAPAPSTPSAIPADSGETELRLPTSDEVNDALQQGRAWLEENFSEEDVAQLPQVDQKQLLELLQPIARAFEAGEFGDLAAIREQASQVLGWLREQPWGKPYADWLTPRMDYLDIAWEAETTAQQQWALEQQQNPSATPPSLEKPSPSTLRFQVVRDRVRRNAQSRATWTKKVAQHAPPPRAQELAPVAKEIFRAHGVPPEMVWLAEVESSFDPEARSPVGARGLFQFMPATAQRFGLRTFPIDERTDPEKSAKAAAQYLRALHGRFGDWPLALAAYNAGEGRVGRALDASKTRTFDAIAAKLPAETRLYVPKVMATVAAREGVDPFALPAPWDPAKAASATPKTAVAPVASVAVPR